MTAWVLTSERGAAALMAAILGRSVRTPTRQPRTCHLTLRRGGGERRVPATGWTGAASTCSARADAGSLPRHVERVGEAVRTRVVRRQRHAALTAGEPRLAGHLLPRLHRRTRKSR